MNRTIFFLMLILQMAGYQNAFSLITSDQKQRYASIGDFTLESGKHIIDCKIGYRAFGKLNASRSNAVIYPTADSNTTYMMELFGAGAEVDTNRFYLIMIDALGNGDSTSPSNSISQPKILFPQFNIRDMVNSQCKMLIISNKQDHIIN